MQTDEFWCLVCQTKLRSRSAADYHFSSFYHAEQYKLAINSRNLSGNASIPNYSGVPHIGNLNEPQNVHTFAIPTQTFYITPHDYFLSQELLRRQHELSVTLIEQLGSCSITNNSTMPRNRFSDKCKRPGSSLFERSRRHDDPDNGKSNPIWKKSRGPPLTSAPAPFAAPAPVAAPSGGNTGNHLEPSRLASNSSLNSWNNDRCMNRDTSDDDKDSWSSLGESQQEIWRHLQECPGPYLRPHAARAASAAQWNVDRVGLYVQQQQLMMSAPQPLTVAAVANQVLVRQQSAVLSPNRIAPESSSPRKSSNYSKRASSSTSNDVVEKLTFGKERKDQDMMCDIDTISVRHPDLLLLPEQDIKQLFSVFGEVESVHWPMKKQASKSKTPSLMIKFNDCSAVKEALKKTIFYKRKFTFVNAVFNHAQVYKSLKASPSVEADLYDIEGIDVEGKSLEETVVQFRRLMQADDELQLHEKQLQVCRDLERTFDPLLPGVQATLFGSSLIGLRLNDSDTDIFMDCPSGQPPRNFVQKNASVMFKCPLYQNVLKIGMARVPIITFSHVATELTCDVTFLNKLGLRNSQMLRFLLSLDSRVRDLALIVKFWARAREISGTGKFSNYALSIMVVFYLQQLDYPLLPPVRLLQDLAEQKEMYDNWECSFTCDATRLPPITNQSTLKQLLTGFFEFWSKFDYAKYVACPLLGMKIERTLFNDFENLPPELDSYKKYARIVDSEQSVEAKVVGFEEKKQKLGTHFPVCVQDVFDLSFNITRMCKEHLLSKFQWLCSYYKEEVLDKTSTRVLLNLFVPPKKQQPVAVKTGKQVERSRLVYMDDTMKLPFEVASPDQYKEAWFKVMRLGVVRMLTHVFALQLAVDESNEAKAIAACEEADVNNKAFRTVCLTAKGYGCVFEGRTVMRKKLVKQSEDPVDNDCILTRAILQSKREMLQGASDGDKDKQMGAFDVNLKLFCFPHDQEKKPHLLVKATMRENSTSAAFQSFCNGLSSALCTNFLNTLKRVYLDPFCALDTNAGRTKDASSQNSCLRFDQLVAGYVKRCNEQSNSNDYCKIVWRPEMNTSSPLVDSGSQGDKLLQAIMGSNLIK